MSTDIAQAARRFRFEKWENHNEEFIDYLRANALEVAEQMPRVEGETLFELLEVQVPAAYKGLPEPEGHEVLRARSLYLKDISPE